MLELFSSYAQTYKVKFGHNSRILFAPRLRNPTLGPGRSPVFRITSSASSSPRPQGLIRQSLYESSFDRSALTVYEWVSFPISNFTWLQWSYGNWLCPDCCCPMRDKLMINEYFQLLSTCYWFQCSMYSLPLYAKLPRQNELVKSPRWVPSCPEIKMRIKLVHQFRTVSCVIRQLHPKTLPHGHKGNWYGAQILKAEHMLVLVTNWEGNLMIRYIIIKLYRNFRPSMWTHTYYKPE